MEVVMARWMIGAALVASVALNAVLLLRGQEARGQAEPARRDPEPATPGRETSELHAAPPSSPAATSKAGPRTASRADPRLPAAQEGGASASQGGPEIAGNNLDLEDDVRNFLGRECLRKELLSEREKNDKWLRGFLDPEERGRMTDKWVKRYSEQLQLTSAEASQFERDYRALVDPLWEQVAGKMDADSIDYAAVVELVRALQAGEDRLFLALRGPGALEKIRAALLESRAHLIAMLEAYAEADR
jgi:hypothetical protein